MSKPLLVVLTGAGISAESGIKTFRDAGGLWEGYDVMDVASPQGWANDQALVLDFYNQRRKQLSEVLPNEAHIALAAAEQDFEVIIITQNVDDLHERGGSSRVLHLHGELKKVRSTLDPQLVYDWGYKALNEGDTCEKGAQLRPHIVWFGEEVPMMDVAISWAERAEYFLVVGTSLVVYPAAGLLHYAPTFCPRYIVDPHKPDVALNKQTHFIQKSAVAGVPEALAAIRTSM